MDTNTQHAAPAVRAACTRPIAGRPGPCSSTWQIAATWYTIEQGEQAPILIRCPASRPQGRVAQTATRKKEQSSGKLRQGAEGATQSTDAAAAASAFRFCQLACTACLLQTLTWALNCVVSLPSFTVRGADRITAACLAALAHAGNAVKATSQWKGCKAAHTLSGLPQPRQQRTRPAWCRMWTGWRPSWRR